MTLHAERIIDEKFDFEKEYSKLLTPDIVSYIAQIHEYRGRYSTDNVQRNYCQSCWRLPEYKVRKRLTESREL